MVDRRDHLTLLTAARCLLAEGHWCALEVCVDVPAQRWEPRLVIFAREAEVVAEVVAEEILLDGNRDARLVACDRRTLRPVLTIGAHLCHIADLTAPSTQRRHAVLVRDGMNAIVVTVGPAHSLREAAKRMTARGVGAAVVIDNEQPGPGIITERDILHSNGVGQDIDAEVVRDHLTSELVYAAADWSLEQAAAEMVRGGFRHVVVVDESDIVGILSMRDIVRCWTSEGATCAVGEPR